MLILLKENRKPIKIEPIKIVSLVKNQKNSSQKIDKEHVVSSKEEVSNKILESLKETIAQQQR